MQTLRTSSAQCPNCQAEQDGVSAECARCGIIFAKYKPLPLRATGPGRVVTFPRPPEGMWGTLWRQVQDWALVSDGPVNPFTFAGRALVFVGLVVWGWTFVTATIASNYVGESFMHLVNLPFHEAGHIFFTPLGRFMQVLGGSLGQLIMPLVCLFTFLIQQHNPFAASVTLWWFAESLMDLAPYINDARALELILIGGVTGKDVEDYHDWEYILRTLGWLQHDHTIAVMAHGLGVILMLTAWVWGGALLLQQYRRLE